jgi:hypothetical protein
VDAEQSDDDADDDLDEWFAEDDPLKEVKAARRAKTQTTADWDDEPVSPLSGFSEATSPKIMQQGQRRSSRRGSAFAADEDLDEDAWVGEKHLDFATEIKVGGRKESTRSAYVEFSRAQAAGHINTKDKREAARKTLESMRRLSISDVLAKRAQERSNYPPRTLRFQDLMKFSDDFVQKSGGHVLKEEVATAAAKISEVKKTKDARFQEQLKKKERHKNRPFRLEGILPGF